MDKTYISPTVHTVRLGTMQMLAESIQMHEKVLEDTNKILTKEDAGGRTGSDVSVWDNEW